MGADYSAFVYIVAHVQRADFVEQVTRTEVLCDHPKAEGEKFCPECGLPKNKRTKTVTEEVWRPKVRPLLDDQVWVEEGLTFEDVVSGETGVNGLDVFLLNTSSMDRGAPLVIGKKVAHAPGSTGWGGQNPVMVDLNRFSKQVADVQKRVAQLGITSPVQIAVVCYCSV